jgi:uncharacterized protein YbbC (DUF1343 family)
MKNLLFFAFLLKVSIIFCKVDLGVDLFFEEGHYKNLKGKKIGLIVNHSSVDSSLISTVQRFKSCSEISLIALFSPEHGLDGKAYAFEKVDNSKLENIIVYSLHGTTRRPTKEMLKNIDILIFDIQDLGSRSYTYSTTLFYAMEEAAKNNVEIIVLDRPNPINGLTVDGPMLEKEFRSYVGYINVPYCHGMTIGELALFFNSEYSIGCKLKVIAMKGWKRSMSFKDTNLHWIPTSPNIPEGDTPYFYPTTGILGELKILNIGIGYTMPFKIIGAPWINCEIFSEKLNSQKLPGVFFMPFHFRPFYGAYKGENCQGVKIVITNPSIYKPLQVQYLIMGLLKSLYPKIFLEKIEESSSAKDLFNKVNGSKEVYNILIKETYPYRKLMDFLQGQQDEFMKKREKYLLYQ